MLPGTEATTSTTEEQTGRLTATAEASTATTTTMSSTSSPTTTDSMAQDFGEERVLCLESGESYLEAELELSPLGTDINLRFRTADPEAMLLVIPPPTNSTGFVALALQGGRVVFSLDAGQPEPLVVRGGQAVSDGAYHTVTARRHARASGSQTVETLLLTVDGVQSRVFSISVRVWSSIGSDWGKGIDAFASCFCFVAACCVIGLCHPSLLSVV